MPEDKKPSRNYKLEFDFYDGTGYWYTSRNWIKGFVIKGSESILATFKTGMDSGKSKAETDHTSVIYSGDSTDNEIGYFLTRSRGATPTGLTSKNYWHHIVIIGTVASENSNGSVTMSVTRISTGTSDLKNEAEWVELSNSYQTIDKIFFHTQSASYEAYSAIDNIVLYEEKQTGVPSAPQISVIGANDYDYKQVVVEAADGTVGDYTLYYRIGAGEWNVYSGAIEIAETTTIVAKTTISGVDSSETSQEVVACQALPTPTAKIIAVNGISRTLSIDSSYDVVISESESGPFSEIPEKTISTEVARTYYIKAYFDSTVKTGIRLYSDAYEISVDAGAYYKLDAPKFSARGYEYVLIDASTSITIGDLIPTIHYSIDGGDATVVSARSLTIPLAEGGVVDCWASYDGCEDSDSARYTALKVTPALATVATYDYYSLFKTGKATSYGDATYTSTITGAEATYYSLYYGDNELFNPLWYAYGLDGSKPRWANAWDGLWQNNSGRQSLVFASLPKGSLIYLNYQQGQGGNGAVNTIENLKDVTTSYAAGQDSVRVYEVSAAGDCAINVYRYTSIYSIRVCVPAVASANDVGYATLQEAANNAAEGATITLKASTTDSVTLKRGQKLVCGDYTCGTVGGATEYINAVYDEDTKTYTAIETATWQGSSEGAAWNVASSWNTNVEPSQYTNVKFSEGDAKVYVTQGASCASMAVEGAVTFAQVGDSPTDNKEISLYGNVTESGVVKLSRAGLRNASGGKIAFAPALENLLTKNGNDWTDSWITGGAVEFTGPVTINGRLVTWESKHVFKGNITIKGNGNLASWGAQGYEFDDITITAEDGTSYIYLGATGAGTISGTGFTLVGTTQIDVANDGDTAAKYDITAPIKLAPGATLTLIPAVDGTSGSTVTKVDPAEVGYEVKSEPVDNGTKYFLETVATEATITVEGAVVGGTLTIKDANGSVYQSGDKVSVGTTLTVTFKRSTPYRNVTLKVNNMEQTEVADGDITYTVTAADAATGIVITATGTPKVYRYIKLVDANDAVAEVSFVYNTTTYYYGKSPYVSLLFDTDSQQRTLTPSVTLKEGYMLTATPADVVWPANETEATLTVETAKIVAKVGDTPYASFEEAITNAGGADIVIVDAEAALPAGYKAVDGKLVEANYVAEVAGQKYESLAEAVEKAADGATVTLVADAGVDQTIVIAKNLTIALGDSKTITANNCRALWIKSGNVTISGTGTITTGANSTFGASSSVIRVGDSAVNNASASLTIGVGVAVTTDYCYGVTAFGKNNGIALVVNGTVTVTGTVSAVSGNGLSNTTSITINDGAVVSATADAGVYFPCPGTLTVTGGTITGPVGVYVKSGTVAISGGVITGTAAKAEYAYSNNGLIATGDALVVDSCNYPGAAPAVLVTGGEFTSTSADAVASYQYGQSEKVEDFVSGGTFNTPVSLDYCAAGVIPTAADAQGKFSVEAGYVITWDVDGVKTPTAVKAGVVPTPTDPTKPHYAFAGWTPAVGAATADATYTATWTANDVTLGTPEVTWGADFTNAVVTATVTDGYADVAYTLTYGQTTVAGTVEGTTVTFNVPVAEDARYANFGYSIAAKVKDASVGETSGSAIVADKETWFSATASATTNGSWTTQPTVDGSKMTFTESNTFTPNAASSGKIVVLDMGKVCFGDANDAEITGAQAGIRIGANDKFEVLSATGWTATSVAANGETEYDVVVTINYGTKKYSVKVGESTIDNIALAGDKTKVESIEFKGAGSLESLTGEYFDGAMVKDGKDNTYDTVAAAIAAYVKDSSIAPLKMLHDGIAPAGWTIDENGVLTKASIEVESEADKTLVAVPQGCTSIDTLIDLSNRYADDQIQAYDSKTGKFNTWKLSSEKVWTGVGRQDQDDAQPVFPTEADKVLKAGQAVWVLRMTEESKAAPIRLNASYADAPATVALETGWNLVAPTVDVEDLNSLNIVAAATDRIVVPSANGGAPAELKYKNGKWGYNTAEKDESGHWVLKFETKGITIPAGTGFWYVSDSDKNISL